jgi:cyclic lactone autoinducer peptide
MTKVLRVLRSNSLKLVGAGALFVGTLFVSSLKFFIFYQPELPKELQN